MNINFDHLSLSAKNPEAMRDLLCELLDLKVGKRHNFSFPGYFLYAGDKDLIHIFDKRSDNLGALQQRVSSQNIVHHICFYSDNLDELLQRTNRLKLPYSINNIPDSPRKQLFIRAPENLLIEIQAEP